MLTSAQVIHYVDKPESFLSNLISSGVYLFDVTVFAHINKTMSNIRPSDGPVLSPAARVLFREEEDISPELLSLEQDVLAPLAPSKKLFVFQINNPWQQIKTAASALSANTLYLQIAQDSASDDLAPVSKANATQPEIIGPCYIDSTASIEPGAKVSDSHAAAGQALIVIDWTQLLHWCRLQDLLRRPYCQLNSPR